MIENVGILLRGKSLENLEKISDKFRTCFIVNDFKEELEMFRSLLKDKHIFHFANSMRDAALQRDQYRDFRIKTIMFSFTETMAMESKNKKKNPRVLEDHYRSLGLTNIHFLPSILENTTKSIKNTGLSCIMYVSKFIRTPNIWIAGLDFYESDYLVKENFKYQRQKAKDIKMIESFVKIVRAHPNITYHLSSRHYEGLPSMENLRV